MDGVKEEYLAYNGNLNWLDGIAWNSDWVKEDWKRKGAIEVANIEPLSICLR